MGMDGYELMNHELFLFCVGFWIGRNMFSWPWTCIFIYLARCDRKGIALGRRFELDEFAYNCT